MLEEASCIIEAATQTNQQPNGDKLSYIEEAQEETLLRYRKGKDQIAMGDPPWSKTCPQTAYFLESLDHSNSSTTVRWRFKEEKKRRNLSNRWKGTFTLDDVDNMFDDIDVCPTKLHPLSVQSQSSCSDSNHSGGSVSPVLQINPSPKDLLGPEKSSQSPVGTALHVQSPAENVLHPVERPPDQLDIDLHVAFKAHGPVKTSSPIEQIMRKNSPERPDYEDDHVVSPILFECEEPHKQPLPTQNPEVTEKSDDESPPKRVILTKKSVHKEKATRQENTETSPPAVRKTPKPPAPENNSKGSHTQRPAEMSSHAGKDLNAFLLRLKRAVQSNPPCKSKVKVAPPAPPPEPEEDFLILEEDAPLWVTIPTKSATKRRQNMNKNSSIDKESTADKEPKPKDNPPEEPQEEQVLEKAISIQETQTVNQKTKKKKKGKEQSDEVIRSGNENDGLPSPEDFPAGDSVEQQKPVKKRQKSKGSGKENDLPEVRVDVETEEASQKREAKAHKSKKKNLKDGKEITTASRTKTLKENRKQLQRPNAVTEEVEDVEEENQEQSEAGPVGTEDLGSFTEKEVMKPEVDERNKNSAESGEGSAEEVQVLGKRRRKPAGQWWLSCSKSSEEAEPPQPPKKSKQKNKESSSAAPQAARARKDKVNKKRNQKQPAMLSRDQTETAKENQRKRTKKGKAKGEKIKDEIIHRAEAEQEQQEVPDGDLNQESSPLVFTQRDLGLNSEGQIFQKVYHHSPSNKTPTSAVTPRQRKDQLREAESTKRRRKPPGSWWDINAAGDSGGTPSQPQQLHVQELKPQKDQKKRSKQRKAGLASPKNGKAGSKPPGGALESPVMRLPTPKMVRRSLATFKDIFSSGVNTPTVVANRDAHQSSRRDVTPRPAEEVSDACSVNCSRTDPNVHQSRNELLNQEIPEGRVLQSEDVLKGFRSGPSSMIEIQNYEEMDSQPSRVQAVLHALDLCAPPLKPLTLHSKDRANLTEWFQSLWSTTADDTIAINPDQFQWYFYQDRALGIQVDLNSTSFCSGKILMGSHMKKPLWVDHSATTVFNLLTSSVSVTINGSASRYSPGQAFIVECGHAYSIENTNAQPAVLYFTRMSAESAD